MFIIKIQTLFSHDDLPLMEYYIVGLTRTHVSFVYCLLFKIGLTATQLFRLSVKLSFD